MAVGNVLLPIAVKRWFPDRVGQATGWYAVAMALGTAAAAGLSVPLATATGSVRIGLASWALPALAAAVPWWWLRKADGRRPVDPPGRAADHAVAAAVRRHPTAWGLTGYFGLQSLAAYVVMGWLPSIYRDAGLSAGTSGGLLALLMLVGVPTSFVLPVLAARRDDQRALVTVLTVSAAAAYAGLMVAPALVSGFILSVLQALALFGSPAILALPAGFHTITTQIWGMFHYPPRIEAAAAVIRSAKPASSCPPYEPRGIGTPAHA
jgi:CP family cyanate transporter-like MFS transporter